MAKNLKLSSQERSPVYKDLGVIYGEEIVTQWKLITSEINMRKWEKASEGPMREIEGVIQEVIGCYQRNQRREIKICHLRQLGEVVVKSDVHC